MTDFVRAHENFRQRLIEGKSLLGTFLKAPNPIVTEWLGSIGYDFTVIDQEHSAFGRETTDGALLAARAANIAALVRTPDSSTQHILAALDAGAVGVVVPHVQSAQQAADIVAAARYSRGRGFALATRAANYSQIRGRDHIAQSDKRTVVIAQIEDRPGLENVEAIVAVEGIDAVFIGRGDLSVALGEDSPNAPAVLQASEIIAAAARRHGKAVSAFVSDASEAAVLTKTGVTAIMFGSDQALFQLGAQHAARSLVETLGNSWQR